MFWSTILLVIHVGSRCRRCRIPVALRWDGDIHCDNWGPTCCHKLRKDRASGCFRLQGHVLHTIHGSTLGQPWFNLFRILLVQGWSYVFVSSVTHSRQVAKLTCKSWKKSLFRYKMKSNCSGLVSCNLLVDRQMSVRHGSSFGWFDNVFSFLPSCFTKDHDLVLTVFARRQ